MKLLTEYQEKIRTNQRMGYSTKSCIEKIRNNQIERLTAQGGYAGYGGFETSYQKYATSNSIDLS